MVDVGGALRRARDAAGMSQRALARAAGVPHSTVGRIERGDVDARVGTLAALADALGSRVELEFAPVIPDLVAPFRSRITAICRRHGAYEVALFGSVAEGRDDAGSDVDLLVDLDDEADLLSLVRLERELSELLERRVDVIPRGAVTDALHIGRVVPL